MAQVRRLQYKIKASKYGLSIPRQDASLSRPGCRAQFSSMSTNQMFCYIFYTWNSQPRSQGDTTVGIMEQVSNKYYLIEYKTGLKANKKIGHWVL
jgi:hypothetical protein